MDAQHSLPLKRITIFKNGTCLITREGKLPVKEGVARLPIPQEALFGGYWLGAVNNSIRSLTFKKDNLQEREEAKELVQYLAGNVGKRVTVSLLQKETAPVTGKLIGFDKETLLAKIKQDNDKVTLVQAQSIYQVDFYEEAVATYLKDSISRMVIVTPEKPATELQLQQLAMQAGVNWVPSYLFKMKDEKTARLEMKATIENSIEDIVNGEAELVVGSPQMYFGQRRDPITYDHITEGSAGPEYNGDMQMLSNSMRERSSKKMSMDESAFEGSYQTEGEKTGDLYIYQIGKITLPKESKGSYPVFAATVDYAHKYEAILVDHTNFVNNRYIQPEESPADVIHSLAVKNTATVPLTTAPVMVVTEKEQFLAQDLLRYTPVGGTVDIKLSKALDILIKNAEEEVNRKEEAKQVSGYQYTRVVIKGTVTISNLQKKEVVVSVKKSVAGNVIKSGDARKVTKEGMSSDYNPVSTIAWEVTMGSNSQRVLNYEYEVFFRQ
ncbi:MAG: hypothetical protein K2U26_02320 [Cyclobacteriaceae bacterium]|nr:hypothetical protein [Cyclobacteriaceae bacterium]